MGNVTPPRARAFIALGWSVFSAGLIIAGLIVGLLIKDLSGMFEWLLPAILPTLVTIVAASILPTENQQANLPSNMSIVFWVLMIFAFIYLLIIGIFIVNVAAGEPENALNSQKILAPFQTLIAAGIGVFFGKTK